MDVVSCRASILDLRGGDKVTDACISSLLWVMDVVSCRESILDLRGCDKVTDACISSLLELSLFIVYINVYIIIL